MTTAPIDPFEELENLKVVLGFAAMAILGLLLIIGGLAR